MYNILVIDDNQSSLQLIEQTLQDKYAVVSALSCDMVSHYLEKFKPDLILLNYLLSELDGKEMIMAIHNNPNTASIPIIVLSADRAGELEIECLRQGAADFITLPFVPEVMLSRIEKTMELEDYRNDLLHRLYDKSKQMEYVSLQAITAVANTIDAKDNIAKGHSIRVAEYASAVAKALGLSNKEIQNLHYVAMLHDIGKIGVPDSILNKPAKLSSDEYEIVRKHTTIGADILKDIQMIKEAKEGALYHHERYDGKGYPVGMSGEEIPTIARILSIADAYDAMTSSRIYKNSLTREQAIEEIERGSGTQFDPNIARIFIKMIQDGLTIATLSNKEQREKNSIIEESSNLLQRVIEEREAKVEREAARDYLTGLFNRRAAEIQVNQFLREKEQRGTFFIADLDNFKSVNDNFGHIAGDYALKKVSTLLQNNTRDSDVVCRLGGDEFVIFFKGLVHRDILIKKAKKLIQDFFLLKTSDETMAQTSLSIGIAMSGIDGDDFESLYVTADKSLYYVKQNGKNSYHFYSDDTLSQEEQVNSALVDIEHLMDMMKETGEVRGVLAVGYGEFQRIYNFIQRCVQRTKQEVQVLLFTLNYKKGITISSEIMEEAMDLLEQAIFQSLRCSDVSTRYSCSQFILVLNNSNDKGAEIVVNRISSLFYDRNRYEEIVLSKDVAQMTGDYEKSN